MLDALRSETLKENAAFRAADRLLATGLVAWLATQDEAARAAIFVAIEATLSASDSRKIAQHPHRPEIDPARIEQARAEIAAIREEALRAREQAKLAADRAKFEALRDKLKAADDKAASGAQ